MCSVVSINSMGEHTVLLTGQMLCSINTSELGTFSLLTATSIVALVRLQIVFFHVILLYLLFPWWIFTFFFLLWRACVCVCFKLVNLTSVHKTLGCGYQVFGRVTEQRTFRTHSSSGCLPGIRPVLGNRCTEVSRLTTDGCCLDIEKELFVWLLYAVVASLNF